MKAGRMDRRVSLQARTLSRNSYGEETESWSEIAEVWAEKVDLRGREYYAAAQANADVTTRWRIRYRSDVTVLHRLLYDSVVYEINQVAEIGRQAGLELITTAQVP